MKKLTKYSIGRMKQAERITAARDQLGLDVPDDIRRPELIGKMVAALPDYQANQKDPSTADQTMAAPMKRQPGNKDLFLQLAESEQGGADPSDQEQPKSNRGGRRENAGRKPGVTLEQSAIDNLPTTSNRSVEYGIKWLFRLWAQVSGCKVIALDDEELAELSIDTTQFLAHHNISLPQGLHIDAKFAGNVLEKVGGRVSMHKLHKSRMAAAESEGSDVEAVA